MNQIPLRRMIVVIAIGLLAAACSGAGQVLSDVGNSMGDRPAQGDSDGGAPAPQPTSAPVNEPQQAEQQLIVYTGSLDLEVAELRPAIAQADQVVRGLGGHVASSEVSDSSDHRTASVTYRIPAERWEEALAGLRAVGARVVDESTSSEDVTAQVVDLDARIANLRASETALQGIMDRAGTIDDVLEVQRELTRVRSEIESMTAQRDLLANRAALATLEVRFNVPLPASARATEGWDLGREVDGAIAALVRVGQGLTSLAIWMLIVVLPLVIPIVVVAFVAYRMRRRWQASQPGSGEIAHDV